MTRLKLCRTLAALSLASAAATAGAAGNAFENIPVMADEELADLRGGFITYTGSGLGLEVSFGIERAISVNGELVAHSNFTLPRMDQLGSVANSLGEALLQNGPGNLADPNALPGASLFQNTLDNQVIKSLTVINASVASLSLFRELHFNNIVNDGLLQAVR